MKKILMLLAMIVLILGVSGQAMATSYFTDGHLIRVVYQYGGLEEVVTDLGPINFTGGTPPANMSFTSNPFPMAGSPTFPLSNWKDLQVAYFAKTANGVWVSGLNATQENGAHKFTSFESAVNSIYAVAIAAAGGTAQATIPQSNLQSYESMMNNGETSIIGFFAGFTPDFDGEQNLGSIYDSEPFVDSYLYYYGAPDSHAAGVQIGLIHTFADGTSELEVGNVSEQAHFVIMLPASATAGTSVTGQVAAVDSENYLMSSYSGKVDFTSTDPSLKAKLPKGVKIKNGIGTFTATLLKSGLQVITSTEVVTPPTVAMTGTSEIVVKPAVVKSFAVSAPIIAPATTAVATTGIPFNFTVTAKDAYGNTVPSYAGTLAFTTSDKGYGPKTALVLPVLPSNSTLSNGVGTFSATLLTGGMPGAAKPVTQTITVTDQTMVLGKLKPLGKGTSNAITVTWAPAAKLVLGAPVLSAGKAGAENFSVVVTANDAHNYFTQNIIGLVTITTNDTASGVVMPAAAPLVKGVGTFKGILKTKGSTITASGTGVISATSSAITW